MTQVECYFQDLEEVLLSTMQKERFWAMLTYRERDSLENWSFVMNLGHIYLYFIFQIFCRSVEWVRTFASDWNNLSRTTARCIQRVDADRFSSIKTNLHFKHVFFSNNDTDGRNSDKDRNKLKVVRVKGTILGKSDSIVLWLRDFFPSLYTRLGSCTIDVGL